MSTGVVIPAAGQGKRMGSKKNKQYLVLLDRPVLAHTISLFYSHPLIKEIVVVVRKDELPYCRQKVIEKYFDNSIRLVAGGKTRRESVFAGLKVFSPAINSVIIHDGARPLLPPVMVDRVVEKLDSVSAITMGIPLKDTVKKIDKDGFVCETPPRNELMAIQTPQAFDYNLIFKAHQRVPLEATVTDDASLVEYLGYRVQVIEGSEENIKITTPLDLIIAKEILNRRKGNE